MPTTHVEPGAEALLQEIANSVWKARKIVVITGAGISTNSGIPDFRSENGLYSLIQAQFEAARRQDLGTSSDNDLSNVSREDRPAKRRRLSRAGSPESNERLFPGLGKSTQDASAQSGGGQGGMLGEDPSRVTANAPHLFYNTGSSKGSQSGPDMMADQERGASFDQLPAPALTPPAIQTPVSNHISIETQGAYGNRPTEEAHVPFASSPPCLSLETVHLQRRPDLMNLQTRSSSPLSSPPPITYDPYQESQGDPSSSPPSQVGNSSRSPSEGPSSVSTPPLTSQTSFASSSSRNSLPNMKGRDLFDAQIWSCPIKTSVFYTFATTLRQKVRSAEPTSSHRFISVLRDSRKLVRCYTQNIDQLEERVGLTTSLSLGAGSRYRFSARAGRKPDGARTSMKAAETSVDPAQGSSQQGEEQQPESQPLEKPQTNLGSADSSESDGAGTVPSSLSGPDPSSTQDETQASIPSAAAAAPAPASPNRGVECVFLHGSLAKLRCFVCARTASWDEEARQADTLAGRQPTCPHCAGAAAAREEKGKRALGVGKLRPDIVLYGEENPCTQFISPLIQHDLSLGPDMLLIMGTSMRVHGLKVLVREFAKAVHDRGGKVVLVNFTKPPDSVWAEVIDYWVQWDCDAWVNDLRTRKPALWLPPDAPLPEEEKQKPKKPSRRQSGDEHGKQREGTEKTSGKAKRGRSSLVGEESERGGASTEQEQREIYPSSQLHGMPPPRPSGQTLPKRFANTYREPRLNPNAKRPAAIRDHKLNGAYLVWKIMSELRRVTGGNPPSSAAQSPSGTPRTARPRPKGPRKSAPSASMSLEVKPEQVSVADPFPPLPADQKKPSAAVSSPVPPKQPDGSVESVVSAQAESISAAVKSRKRKQTVWRMIGGVETKVSLAPESENMSPLPTTTARFRPSPQPSTQLHMRTLPLPIPTKPAQSISLRSSHSTPTSTMTDQFGTIINNNFRETDRLIAQLQLHRESSPHIPSPNPMVSRPSTPPVPVPVRLAPLKIPPATGTSAGTVDRQQETVSPKLATLEPNIPSPGPGAAAMMILCDVGSPSPAETIAASRERRERRLSWATAMGDPFFFADPLGGLGHLGGLGGTGGLAYPPSWTHAHQGQEGRQVHGIVGAPGGEECDSGGSAGRIEEGPDEQLRKEQEVALMLSTMRGT
ncbi:hypothetical protein N656DRAFT_829078 [Canariomyces notabilis]|uniref:Deacetylase sirtuin-type domain-containing protein n=1 Tax=Canariomyces notabilis TaxID=2074819 RepID=A0AAN6YSF1_9PEZI|nr:hypothetical protein N656DRAFT_829078 [Canariomyces arenarius]